MPKKIIEIELSKKIKTKPEFVFQGEIKKAGTGGVIYTPKKHIGKKAVVIIKEEKGA